MMTNTMETQASVRPYGKSELAKLYLGGKYTDKSACRWLNKEIAKCPGLLEELCRLGYLTRQKSFTVAQVRAIFNAIGQPTVKS